MNTYRQRQFDRRYGVDTAGTIELSSLDIDPHSAQRGVEYAPSTPELVSTALSWLEIDYTKYTFVDCGCGKGLALLAASSFPFKRIVGVELSERLCAIARNNIAVYRSPMKRCSNVEIVRVGAESYSLPLDPLVIYLFNPFHEEVMAQLMGNVKRSWEHTPRHIVVIYHNPIVEDVIRRSGFLQKLPFVAGASRLVLYATATGATGRARRFSEGSSGRGQRAPW